MLVFAPKNAYTWCKNGIFDCFGKAKETAFQESLERLFLLRSDRKIRAKRCSKICVLKDFLPAVFYAKTTPPTPPKKQGGNDYSLPFLYESDFLKNDESLCIVYLAFQLPLLVKTTQGKGRFFLFLFFF
jgi:hypothetical protein